MDLDLLLLHTHVVYALQDLLHVTLQFGPLRHQPPPAVNLGDGRLVLETTYQHIHLCTMGVIHPEHVQVGGVVVRALCRHSAGFDMKGLPIQVRVVLNNGQDEGVVSHYDLDVVGLLGVSLQVCDWEVNSSRSFVPYEPRRHNVRPVFGWGVVG